MLGFAVVIREMRRLAQMMQGMNLAVGGGAGSAAAGGVAGFAKAVGGGLASQGILGALQSGGQFLAAGFRGLSPLAKLGVVGLAASFALKKLGDTAERVANQVLDTAKMQAHLGSGTNNTAVLQIMGRAMGVDMVAMAKHFQNVTQGGIGAALAGAYGEGPQFNLGMPVDRGARLLRVLERMANDAQKSPAGRARALGALQAWGMEDLAPMLHYTPETFRMMRRTARFSERMQSPEMVNRAAQVRTRQEEIGLIVDEIKMNIAAATLPVVSTLSRFVLRLTRGSGLRELAQAQKGAQDAQLKATQAQTDATLAMTNELRMTRTGIHGGGLRANTAIPRAFGPGSAFILNANWEAMSARMGAYSVAM